VRKQSCGVMIQGPLSCDRNMRNSSFSLFTGVGGKHSLLSCQDSLLRFADLMRIALYQNSGYAHELRKRHIHRKVKRVSVSRQEMIHGLWISM
jgi:hypothetical protein